MDIGYSARPNLCCQGKDAREMFNEGPSADSESGMAKSFSGFGWEHVYGFDGDCADSMLVPAYADVRLPLGCFLSLSLSGLRPAERMSSCLSLFPG